MVIHHITTFFFLCIVLTCDSSLYKRKLNIGLHAQVYPSDEKVVGSVLTTDGLLAAFKLRNDVDIGHLGIFYPSYYKGYLDYEWDMILIEGWFPSIHSFIILTRNNFPKVKIIFICLDPTYPGLSIVKKFDVDGIITNSIQVRDEFRLLFPIDFMMLAANPIEMKPYANITKDYGLVYVGAGGYMLQQKPELYQLLLDAIPYKLRLHGMHWDSVPVLNKISLGSLPRYDLSIAYASAHVVLASTIRSQADYDMINNRIFEALSCGSIVLTIYSKALEDLNCDAILFINETHTLSYYMNIILNDHVYTNYLRQAAREFIIQRHTWSHRVVQILDFYYSLPYSSSISYIINDKIKDIPTITKRMNCHKIECSRRNCPNLLWIVSHHLQYNFDYIYGILEVAKQSLCTQYHIDIISERDFHLELLKDNSYCTTILDDIFIDNNNNMQYDSSYKKECYPFLSKYQVLFAIITPLDTLDQLILQLSMSIAFHHQNTYSLKLLGYMLGYNPSYIHNYILSNINTTATTSTTINMNYTHYDVLLYRSPYDISLLKDIGFILPCSNRLQFAFGIGFSFQDLLISTNKINNNNIVNNNIDNNNSNNNNENVDMNKVINVKETNSIIIVCFYSFKYLCKKSIRDLYYNQLLHSHTSLISSSTEVVLLPYKLLLLGGLWEDWVKEIHDFTLEELDSPLLSRVIHIRDGSYSDTIISFIQKSEYIILLQTQLYITSFDKINIDCSNHINIHSCVIQNKLITQINTVEDILWPFIAAVTSYTKVILYADHLHLSYVVHHNDDEMLVIQCVVWTMKRFQSQFIKEGLDRLHGFASRISSIEFIQMTYQMIYQLDSSDTYSKIHCFNIVCNEDDQYLIDSYNHAIIIEYDNNSKSFINENNIDVIFIKINYKNFEVGRDGDACIEQMNYQITGIICILRPFKYIALELYPLLLNESLTNNITNNNLQIEYCNEIQFLLQLRGNFYGDNFYQYTQSINISSIQRRVYNNYKGIDKENIIKYNNFKRKWLEINRDDVFIIPAYSC